MIYFCKKYHAREELKHIRFSFSYSKCLRFLLKRHFENSNIKEKCEKWIFSVKLLCFEIYKIILNTRNAVNFTYWTRKLNKINKDVIFKLQITALQIEIKWWKMWEETFIFSKFFREYFREKTSHVYGIEKNIFLHSFLNWI